MNPRTTKTTRTSRTGTEPRPSGSGYAADSGLSSDRFLTGAALKAGSPRTTVGRRTAVGRRNGFTLIEALVSIAILLVIMTAVGKLFRIAGDSISKATANNDILAQVRQLSRQITQDLTNRPKDSFLAISFEYEGPFPVRDVDDPRDTWRFTRADRMVFYTAGDMTAGNREHFIPTGANLPPTLTQAGITAGSPIRGGIARVFYGHDHDYVTVPIAQRTMARRQVVLAPGLYDTLQKLSLPFLNDLDPENQANYSVVPKDIPGIYDSFDYTFFSLSDFENQDRQATYGTLYMKDYFPGEDPATTMGPEMKGKLLGNEPQQSFIRRPIIDLEHRDTNKVVDPAGLGVLFLEGAAEFKIQIWVEELSDVFLDRKDLQMAGISLNSDPKDPVNDLIISSNGNPDVLRGSDLYPRWWPEEDFDRDNIASNGTYLPDEDPTIGDNNSFGDSDFKGFPFTRGVSMGGTNQTIGRARFGAYFGGPYDPDPNVSNIDNAIVGGPPLLRYRGLPKEPRAIKITVRMFDANNRYENGQVHSIVIPLVK